MNLIEKIEASLPNGFHDARLVRLEIDYPSRSAALHLDVLTNAERKPEYRSGTLKLGGLMFIVVDPPGPNATLASTKALKIGSGPGEPSASNIELPTIPSAHFLHWFFVTDWNAFIRIAAKEAAFEWAHQIAARRAT